MILRSQLIKILKRINIKAPINLKAIYEDKECLAFILSEALKVSEDYVIIWKSYIACKISTYSKNNKICLIVLGIILFILIFGIIYLKHNSLLHIAKPLISSEDTNL